MGETPKYKLGYFEPNQSQAADLDFDERRFRTIENQLYNIYTIFGNGVLESKDSVTGEILPSWELQKISDYAGVDLVRISSGKGHVSFKFAETTASYDLELETPIGFTSGELFYYIYAIEDNTTPNLKTVEFVSSLTVIEDYDNYIGLGAVKVVYGTAPSLEVYNTEEYGRRVISLFSSISNLIKDHVHIGGTLNPSPIDLSKHVTGKLSGENIEDLDAAKITTGTLDPERLPLIDHNDLINNGTLTHPQIDSLLAELKYPDSDYKLSDISIANRLQLVLGLKKQTNLFNIDATQYGCIFYMPYSQLNNFYDVLNTSAVVDTDTHRIVGNIGESPQAKFSKLTSKLDFDIAIEQTNLTPPLSPVPENIKTFDGDETATENGKLLFPASFAFIGTNLIVADTFNDRLQIFDSSFTYSSKYPTNSLTQKSLKEPQDVIVGINSTIYICDTLRNRIIKFDNNFNLSYIAGKNFGLGAQGTGNGEFNSPTNFVYDNNYLYVADSGNNRISRFNYTTLAHSTNFKYDEDNDVSTIKGYIYQPLNNPCGIAHTKLASTDFYFIADSGNSRVLCCQLDNDGTKDYLDVYYTIGKNSCGSGYSSATPPTIEIEDASATSPAAATPYINWEGQIYLITVDDGGAGYTEAGTTINIIHNSVVTGYAYPTIVDGVITEIYPYYGVDGDFTSDGSGTGELNHPKNILAYASSASLMHLFISDTVNSRVTKYLYALTPDFLNGFYYNYTLGLYGQQTPTVSSLYMFYPRKLVYNNGYLYIVDSLNSRIIKLAGNIFSTTLNTSITLTSVTTLGESGIFDPDGYFEISKPLNYRSLNNLIINFTETDQLTDSQLRGKWTLGTYSYKTGSASGSTVTSSIGISQYLFKKFDNENEINFSDQNYISFSFKISGDTDYIIGNIYAYLISDSGGNTISFDDTSINSINISELALIGEHSTIGVEQDFYKIISFNSFISNPTGEPIDITKIEGFGLYWDTSEGWENEEEFDLTLTPPTTSNILGDNDIYLEVLEQRQFNADFSPIYIWNYNRYNDTARFIYRFDSGPSNSATFQEVVVVFEQENDTEIFIKTRVSETIEDLDLIFDLNSTSPSTPISGQNLEIVLPDGITTSRYIDIIIELTTSSDKILSPKVYSVNLYYKNAGSSQGIAWDTNIDSAQIDSETRVKWNTGEYHNLNIYSANNSNGDYYIKINEYDTIGRYKFLTPIALKDGYIDSDDETNIATIISGTEDSFIKYLTPWQVYQKKGQGLIVPKDYIELENGNYIICDTENDRVVEYTIDNEIVWSLQGNIRLARKERDFVILNCYINLNTNYCYITFSQWISLAQDGTTASKIAIKINQSLYKLSDETYFSEVGLFLPDSIGKSSTFYAILTNQMVSLLEGYSDIIIYAQIQNPTTNPPFIKNENGEDPDLGDDDSGISCPPNEYEDFDIAGGIECIDGIIIPTNKNIDNIHFVENSTEFSETLLDNKKIYEKTLIEIPVYFGNIFMDNILGPISVQKTENDNIIIATDGSASIRAYDSDMASLWTIQKDLFSFNEVLQGSVYIVDKELGDDEILLLIAQPEIDKTSSNGKVILYNRQKEEIIYEIIYEGFDTIKAIPIDANEFYVSLYDRLRQRKSKLIKCNADGQNIWQFGSQILIRPTGFKILENDNIIITNCTGYVFDFIIREYNEDNTGG